MKISTRGFLHRAETKSRFSGKLSFRPCLEHLEDRRLLSVSPAIAPAADVAAVADSSLSGFVYVDANNNGTKDVSEPPIGGVVVVLTGTATGGPAVNLSTVTLADGSYSFANLAAGNYTITETQPTNYIEGKNAVGSQNSGTLVQTATANAVQNITLVAGVDGTNNNFGDLGFTMAFVSKRSFLDPPTPVVLTTVNSLSITKIDNAGGSSITNLPGNVVPGQSLTYTLVVTNTGTAKQTGVTIADPTLTADLTSDTWTATTTGGATGFSASGSGNIDDTNVTMPAGSSITYVVTGTVISTAAGTLTNSATVTPSGGPSIPATDIDNLPTLAIIKSDSADGTSNLQTVSSKPAGTPGNVNPGQSLIYTVVVSNTGPGNATGVTFTDPIPSDITGATWTAMSTGSATATGFATSGSGNINQTGISLPANSAITYKITGTVITTATGTFSNIATVTPSGGTAIKATDIDNLPNLEIIKSDDADGTSNLQTTTSKPAGTPGNVNPGQSLTYTVVVTNTGPGSATGVKIDDLTLTGDLTGDTWTATTIGGATGFSANGSGNITDNSVTMPAGSSVTYKITGTVISTATNTITNMASVTPPGGVALPATDIDNLPTFEIIKSDDADGTSNLQTASSTPTGTIGNVNPGQSLTYTVVVSNTGPGSATGVKIADLTLTGDLTGDTWSATTIGGATGFTANGSGNITDNSVTMPAGSSVTYKITGTVSPTATGTLSNIASVTPPGSVALPATDIDNLPNLEIIKSDDADGTSNLQTTTSKPAGTPGNVNPGQSLTYTVVVTNTGPGSATGVKIADLTLTADLTGDTWSATTIGGATGFTANGSGNITDNSVTMPAGSSVTYKITGTVISTATGTITNMASVTPPGGVALPATDIDNLRNLEIFKSDDADGMLSNTATVAPIVGTGIPATDNDEIEQIEQPKAVPFGNSAVSSAAVSNISTVPASVGSTTLNAAAVDTALTGGAGRHAWPTVYQASENGPFSAALASGLEWSSSTKTPSTSSSAAVDVALANFSGAQQLEHDIEQIQQHGAHRWYF